MAAKFVPLLKFFLPREEEIRLELDIEETHHSIEFRYMFRKGTFTLQCLVDDLETSTKTMKEVELNSYEQKQWTKCQEGHLLDMILKQLDPNNCGFDIPEKAIKWFNVDFCINTISRDSEMLWGWNSHDTFGFTWDNIDREFVGSKFHIKSTYNSAIDETIICKHKDYKECIKLFFLHIHSKSFNRNVSNV